MFFETPPAILYFMCFNQPLESTVETKFKLEIRTPFLILFFYRIKLNTTSPTLNRRRQKELQKHYDCSIDRHLASVTNKMHGGGITNMEALKQANRTAACKSRVKKKMHCIEMSLRCEISEERNAQLARRVERLKAMRDKCIAYMRHHDYPIPNTASKLASTLISSSSSSSGGGDSSKVVTTTAVGSTEEKLKPLFNVPLLLFDKGQGQDETGGKKPVQEEHSDSSSLPSRKDNILSSYSSSASMPSLSQLWDELRLQQTQICKASTSLKSGPMCSNATTSQHRPRESRSKRARRGEKSFSTKNPKLFHRHQHYHVDNSPKTGHDYEYEATTMHQSESDTEKKEEDEEEDLCLFNELTEAEIAEATSSLLEEYENSFFSHEVVEEEEETEDKDIERVVSSNPTSFPPVSVNYAQQSSQQKVDVVQKYTPFYGFDSLSGNTLSTGGDCDTFANLDQLNLIDSIHLGEALRVDDAIIHNIIRLEELTATPVFLNIEQTTII